MKTPHFRMRVVDALRLQPMDPEQLARCLSTTANNVRDSLRKLCAMGITRKQAAPSSDPRRNVFEIAA